MTASYTDRMKALGALEERVMDVLWRATESLSVREVAKRLRDDLAYTTIMTTLDRLHRKGLLAREKDGIAFVYRRALTRDEYHRRVVQTAVAPLMKKSADGVLAAFVDVASADETNLARLEELLAVARRRKR